MGAQDWLLYLEDMLPDDAKPGVGANDNGLLALDNCIWLGVNVGVMHAESF